MKRGLILLSLAAATAAAVAVPVSASASTLPSPVVGYTYINGNTATVNTIDGYARHADGSLTPLAGSPFTAGGAGTGTGLGSQGAIEATADGQYLFERIALGAQPGASGEPAYPLPRLGRLRPAQGAR